MLGLEIPHDSMALIIHTTAPLMWMRTGGAKAELELLNISVAVLVSMLADWAE